MLIMVNLNKRKGENPLYNPTPEANPQNQKPSPMGSTYFYPN